MFPQAFALHKQSLWKPFLAGWLPAVVVLSVIVVCLLPAVLVWNAGQLWKIRECAVNDQIQRDPASGARFSVATYALLYTAYYSSLMPRNSGSDSLINLVKLN